MRPEFRDIEGNTRIRTPFFQRLPEGATPDRLLAGTNILIGRPHRGRLQFSNGRNPWMLCQQHRQQRRSGKAGGKNVNKLPPFGAVHVAVGFKGHRSDRSGLARGRPQFQKFLLESAHGDLHLVKLQEVGARSL